MAKFFAPSKISENIRETPEGYLVCVAVPIARTGWQDYGPGETPLEIGDDQRTWIYRDPKEVFHPRTIASFQAKPITIKHPQDFVTPENWKELSYGSVQNVRKGEEEDENGEGMLLADFLITDEMAIGLIRNGLREVSCGYDAEYEQTGKGEGRQYNIIGNHVALVEEGRAGSSYAIKDHKERVNVMDVLKDLAEKLKKLGKTVDDAASKHKKTADATDAEEKEKEEKEKAADGAAYDELVKAVKDLSEKVDGLGAKVTSGDAEKEEKPKKEGKEEMAGDEEESENAAEGEILQRVKALEAAIAKILKGKAGDDDESEEMDDDGEEEEMDDDAEEEETDDELAGDEEAEEGEESQKKTGDAARIEILTPGKTFKGKDARVKCLKAFSSTEDGVKIMKKLSGEKKLTIDSKNADMLFLAATALMKSKRGSGLSGTKDGSRFQDAGDSKSEAMTAEKMNEINAKHFGLAK